MAFKLFISFRLQFRKCFRCYVVMIFGEPVLVSFVGRIVYKYYIMFVYKY